MNLLFFTPGNYMLAYPRKSSHLTCCSAVPGAPATSMEDSKSQFFIYRQQIINIELEI